MRGGILFIFIFQKFNNLGLDILGESRFVFHMCSECATGYFMADVPNRLLFISQRVWFFFKGYLFFKGLIICSVESGDIKSLEFVLYRIG